MRKKCCSFLHNSIVFDYNGIKLCCRIGHKGGGYISVYDYDEKSGQQFNFCIKDYINKRNTVIDANQNGCYPECEGCIEIQNHFIDTKEIKLSGFILNHWTKCNTNCIYCFTNKDKEYFNKRKPYKFLPILKQIIKKNLIDYAGIVNFAGGEVSCLDEFDDILKIFDSYDYFYIFNSSAVQFEENIAQRLKKGTAILIVSTDSGTKETHNKIKRTNTYDIVWNNLTKYSGNCKNKHQLYAKYIFIPGINDTQAEINAFFNKVKDARISNIILDIDYFWFNDNRDKVEKYIIDLFYYAEKKAAESNIKFFINDRAAVLLTQGQWADEYWIPFIFAHTDYAISKAYESVFLITKNKKVIHFRAINEASNYLNIDYKKIKKSCELARIGKKFIVNNFLFVYASDFIKISDNKKEGNIDFEKIEKLKKTFFI